MGAGTDVTNKRERMARRRQVRRSQAAHRAHQPAPRNPRRLDEPQRTTARDLWIAVGIVLVVVALLVALYLFGKPRRAPEALSWGAPSPVQFEWLKSHEALRITEMDRTSLELYSDARPNPVNGLGCRVKALL